MSNSLAIYYSADGFDTSRPKLMGRHAAGEEFVKAWARFSQDKVLHCYCRDEGELQHFSKRVESTNVDKSIEWIPWSDWSKLEQVGALFVPSPDLKEFGFQRRTLRSNAFSICGITHTTASGNVMDAIGNLLTAPLKPWDALICTSTAVKSMVCKVLDEYSDYLQERFELPAPPNIPIQLPVIPLGVNCSAFSKNADEKLLFRMGWRSKLGIPDESFVALYMGRLSFHAKAHPIPIFTGLEKTAQSTGKGVALLMCGWFANDAIRNEFIAAAKLYCPSVQVMFLDGRKSQVRETIWYAADAFCSFSDNIQETFGLTPLEGMAAGLPIVASDWNGYRETVRDGVDGFLVPTWMNSPGTANDLAMAYAIGEINYDQYIGYQSQMTCVDLDAAARAFISLASDVQLRRKMGTEGQLRAQNVFDWKHIVDSYEILLRVLSESRVKSELGDCRTHPLRQDPSSLFSGYAARLLQQNTVVRRVIKADSLDSILRLSMNSFAMKELLPIKDVKQILIVLSEPRSIEFLVSKSTHPMKKACILRTIMWMAKVGFVELMKAD